MDLNLLGFRCTGLVTTLRFPGRPGVCVGVCGRVWACVGVCMSVCGRFCLAGTRCDTHSCNAYRGDWTWPLSVRCEDCVETN